MSCIKKKTVLDLFSGCGGMSLGFEQAGFEIKLGIDNWNDALLTFKNNHKNSNILECDLSLLEPSEIGIDSIDVIIGGPPCQGFSIAGKRIIEDERNDLYKSFVRFVSYFKPKVFVMENVPNILSMGNGVIKSKIINDFVELGYNVNSQVLMSSDYGVPQNRKRAFFIGIKNNESFEFPKFIDMRKITSEEAISDLPDVSITDGFKYPLPPTSNYQKEIRNGSKYLFNHQLTEHKEKTIKIISLVPDGGNYKDLPEHLKDTRKVNIAWTRLNSQKPSFTIDTGHRHHFHYKFNRVPTVRESARIQSFPDDFIFFGSKTSQYRQVGNAVPPLLAKHLASRLKEYLNV
jgi:DNA (cytosine-5)-methyltransferase 1